MTAKNNILRRHDRLIVGFAIIAIVSGATGILNFSPALAKSEPAHSKIVPMERVGFADIVEAVSPAVVAISTSGQPLMAEEFMPDFRLPPGSPFEDFFKRFFDNPKFPGQDRSEMPKPKFRAQGSGFVIDPDGTVITNYHVIKGAEDITVITKDGKEYKAELEGHDSKTDLAVLKVDADESLPYVVFGDSDKTRVGDWVLAIGNPFGLGGTATSGIISARGRDINAGPLDDFLQIDAPINRGNSGGPLFDATGKVIGVNTAIFSPNGGNVGIGFAIPSSLASSVINQLLTKGHVDRGWLGVQIQAVTQDLAESLGLDEEKGALVASVVEDSPADKAGIKVGDVILKFGGEGIKKMRDLPKVVADTPADSIVTIDVWRDGKTHDLSVKVGESQPTEPTELAKNMEPSQGKLGLALAELNKDTRTQYGVDTDAEGVLVVRVAPNSPAAEKGIRAGDVIKMVGNSTVSHPEEVVAEVKKATAEDRKSVLLLVDRKGNDRFVAIGIA